MNIAYITNFCPHYRIKLFEMLAQCYDVDYYFFSAGSEWYWQQEHGVHQGKFHSEYLPGKKFGNTRITPSLIPKLWRGKYDVYIKCINGRFALPTTFLIARIKSKPFILWTGIWTRINKPAHKLFFPVTRFIYRHSDAIVVYGQHVKNYLIQEGVAPDKIFLAHHAVDNSQYNHKISNEDKERLLSNLNISHKSKIVLYLGRLEQSKGVRYLIEAFSTLRDKEAVLLLAGRGGEMQLLETMVQQSEISDRVHFVGYVPIEEATLYYSIAWVFVLPSITTTDGKEPWGLVVNEAMNQGIPIIATDAVGAAAGGLVKDGINGFIVAEGNSQALSKALEKVLSDPDLRERMGMNTRKIISKWDNQLMLSGFREAIDFVMRSG